MPRKRLEWKLKERSWLLGERILIGAILDTSPDGPEAGRFEDPDRAFIRAVELSDAGADFIELSHSPLISGKVRVSEAEELRRAVPILKRLRNKIGVPLALETTYAAVAEKAIEYGAEIIHDPSGLTFDPAIAKVAVQADSGMLLSHLRGSPETWPKVAPINDPGGTLVTELRAMVSRASRAGIQPKHLVVDPGFGQGKRREQDVELAGNFGRLTVLEVPLSASPSRKAFVGTPAEEAVAAAAIVLAGAHILRVHDFDGLHSALWMASGMVRPN